LASDGVWEFLTNQTVTDMILKFDDPLEACRAVVAEAYRLWLQNEV
jgi:cGMP-dependent protein kinase